MSRAGAGPTLVVSLNGSRSAADGSAVPMSPEDLVDAALAAVAAGAREVLVHPRTPCGRESLSPRVVGPLLEALRDAGLGAGGRVRGGPGPGDGVALSVAVSVGAEPDHAGRLARVRSWTVLPDRAVVRFAEPGARELAEALLERGPAVDAEVAVRGAAVGAGAALRRLAVNAEAAADGLAVDVKVAADGPAVDAQDAMGRPAMGAGGAVCGPAGDAGVAEGGPAGDAGGAADGPTVDAEDAMGRPAVGAVGGGAGSVARFLAWPVREPARVRLAVELASADPGPVAELLRRLPPVPVLLFGREEAAWPALRLAARYGTGARIGVGDVLHLPDGRAARSNAELVAAAARAREVTTAGSR
ncbi:3-keto-5-aminohexanoate cleavage protein [Streptomyces sp. NPDC059957]|uniref:3-keto-5-aminohexanoate cleavage protein n=1 Tax=unclassified Streptomyces TaxID=2593676 RepID=UPI00366A279A